MRRFPTEIRGDRGDRQGVSGREDGARAREAICNFCADVTRSVVHCLPFGFVEGLGFINCPIRVYLKGISTMKTRIDSSMRITHPPQDAKNSSANKGGSPAFSEDFFTALLQWEGERRFQRRRRRASSKFKSLSPSTTLWMDG